MLTLKLCKGSWAPHIQYPEGATSSTSASVMAMTDAEGLAEMRKLAGPEDSQDRETVEDEFPCLEEDVASEDPYESPC